MQKTGSLPGAGIRNIAILLCSLLAMAVCGCSGQKSFLKTSAADRQYERMLELQQQRSSFDEEKKLEKMIPEGTPESFERLGDAYLRQGNLGMAYVEYSKALRADPGRISVKQKLGYLYLKKEMYTEALGEFDTVLKEQPANINALQGKATALTYLKRLDEAETILDNVLKSDPESWHACILMGMISDRRRQFDIATDYYNKAIAINPGSALAYNNLGISYYVLGKYQESAKALLSALNIAPAPKTYNNLGLALFKLGMYDDSLEAFKRGGDEASAYNNIGVLYMKDKYYDKAIECFERAIELKPSYYTTAHNNLERAKAALMLSSQGN